MFGFEESEQNKKKNEERRAGDEDPDGETKVLVIKKLNSWFTCKAKRLKKKHQKHRERQEKHSELKKQTSGRSSEFIRCEPSFKRRDFFINHF